MGVSGVSSTGGAGSIDPTTGEVAASNIPEILQSGAGLEHAQALGQVLNQLQTNTKTNIAAPVQLGTTTYVQLIDRLSIVLSASPPPSESEIKTVLAQIKNTDFSGVTLPKSIADGFASSMLLALQGDGVSANDAQNILNGYADTSNPLLQSLNSTDSAIQDWSNLSATASTGFFTQLATATAQNLFGTGQNSLRAQLANAVIKGAMTSPGAGINSTTVQDGLVDNYSIQGAIGTAANAQNDVLDQLTDWLQKWSANQPNVGDSGATLETRCATLHRLAMQLLPMSSFGATPSQAAINYSNYPGSGYPNLTLAVTSLGGDTASQISSAIAQIREQMEGLSAGDVNVGSELKNVSPAAANTLANALTPIFSGSVAGYVADSATPSLTQGEASKQTALVSAFTALSNSIGTTQSTLQGTMRTKVGTQTQDLTQIASVLTALMKAVVSMVSTILQGLPRSS